MATGDDVTTTITVNSQNVVILEAAAGALSAHLEDLARRVRHYPIECTFAGYRFVFASRRDIEFVIAQVREKTREYRAAA